VESVSAKAPTVQQINDSQQTILENLFLSFVKAETCKEPLWISSPRILAQPGKWLARWNALE
jgi:hypothetical protein